MRVGGKAAKEWARTAVTGLWGAATCPFREDGSIDEEGFRRNLRYWREVLRLRGIFVAGLMGEFWSLGVEERKRIFSITVEETSGTGMFSLLAVCDLNLRDALGLARHAERVGGDALIVMNPRCYAPQMPRDDLIYEYYETICEAVDMPVFVFNQPSMVGYAISPDCIARIAEIPNVVGVKNVTDPVHQLETRRLCGEKILVSDPDEGRWLVNRWRYGQRALVACPEVYLYQSEEWQPVRDYTEALERGDVEGAERISHEMERVRRAYREAMEGVDPSKRRAVMKYWQELLGQVGGRVRFPQRELNDEEKRRVREAFERSGLRKVRIS